MPPLAAYPDATPTGAAGDLAAPLSLDDASARFEAALARLEALVEAGPLQSDLFRTHLGGAGPADAASAPRTAALRAELDAAKVRVRALEAAAAAASDALGRATAQVLHVLETDAGGADADEAADAPLDPAPAEVEDERR